MKTNNHNEEGMALAVAMLIIFLVTTAIGISALFTMTNARQGDWSRDMSATRSAAEGAVEYGYGVWSKYLNTQYVAPSNAQLSAAVGSGPTFTIGGGASPATLPYLTPSPGNPEDGRLTVQTIDVYGAAAASPSPGVKVMLKNFPGWSGVSNTYLVSAKLITPMFGGRSFTYGVKRLLNYANVPLFQATAFFEDNLELFQTAPMQINGLVHTNSYAYVSEPSANTLTFGDSSDPTYLSFVGGYNDSTAPPDANTWSGYSGGPVLSPEYSAGGKDQQVNQVSRMEPMGADASTLLHPPYDSNGNPTGDVNPNDDSMRELIEPAINTGAYPDPSPIQQRRLYNKAGILVHITKTSTTSHGITTTTYTPTITTQNQTTLTNSQKSAITAALSQQTIYDRREAQNIDLTTVDISQLKSAVSSAANFNNVIYIDQSNSNNTMISTDPQGIRLVNGSSLPANGLTVASQNPIYIQGDYNTAKTTTLNGVSTTPSSAVYADAVTILSNSWNDNNSGSALSSRKASNTTVNTAIVAGFIPSGWTNPATGESYGYSGGLNNFPRFLEDWTSRTFTYKGSMIELFQSQIAVGQWDTGTIYVPPTRVWSFDANFTTSAPPGSPTAVTIARGSLMRY